VTEDDRTSLRRFRQTNGVSLQAHGAILRQMDWTADDYEVGEFTLCGDFLRNFNSLWFFVLFF
jgi:hypothetical protein